MKLSFFGYSIIFSRIMLRNALDFVIFTVKSKLASVFPATRSCDSFCSEAFGYKEEGCCPFPSLSASVDRCTKWRGLHYLGSWLGESRLRLLVLKPPTNLVFSCSEPPYGGGVSIFGCQGTAFEIDSWQSGHRIVNSTKCRSVRWTPCWVFFCSPGEAPAI